MMRDGEYIYKERFMIGEKFRKDVMIAALNYFIPDLFIAFILVVFLYINDLKDGYNH